MNTIYKLFCYIGLHQWVWGKGWVKVATDTDVLHEGNRCIRCGQFQDGTKELK